MSENLPYFFYGSAKKDTSGRTQQYGLFNFVIGRFVLVHHDRAMLDAVKKLFSSRYQLILCSLHTAENFSDGLIDNLVCYNWTMCNVSTIRATRFPEFDIDPFECKQLIELEAFDTQEQIWKDRIYFWMVSSYVALLTNDVQRLGIYHKFIMEELPFFASAEFIAQDRSASIFDLRQQIYSVFYQTFDFKEAENKIQPILKNYATNSHGTTDIKTLDLSIDRQ